VHGECSKQAREQAREESILVRELEDAVRYLGMGEGPRMRGRKPLGYKGVFSQEDLLRMIRDRVLHRISPVK
jgi:hypothetical protein